MNNKIYAAYGSNLNLAQMSLRCPDAKIYAKARLDGYEMVFRGLPRRAVATIEPRKGSSVPILLWSISEKDELALDHYEGFPDFYGKEQMLFYADDTEIHGMVYVMTPGHRAGMPSQFYYDTIKEGYRDCGFDLTALQLAVSRSHELIEQEASSGPSFRFL